MIADRFRSLLEHIFKFSPFDSSRRRENKLSFAPPPVDKKGDDWEKRGHYYRRTLVVTDLPNTVEPPWLAKIRCKLPPEVFVGSQHIRPLERASVEIKWLEQSSHYMAHESNLRERNLREATQAQSIKTSACETLGQVTDRTYIHLRIYFEIRAQTKPQLEKTTDYVNSIAEKEGFSIASIKYRHLESLQANAPTGSDDIGFGTIVTAETAAAIILPVTWSPISLDSKKHKRPSTGDHEITELS